MALAYLKELRGRISLESLAGDTGISVSQLSRYENGKRDPSLDHLQRIANRFQMTVGGLVGEVAPVEVPVVSWVSAGRMQSAEAVLDTMILDTMPVADLAPGDWIMLQVEGDSMDRIAPPGSFICVNRNDQSLVNNGYYVFAMENGDATFKRLRKDPVRFVPFSTNPDHEPIHPRDAFKVIGRVRRVITKL